MSHESGNKWRRRAGRAALALVSTCFAFLLAEGGVRLYLFGSLESPVLDTYVGLKEPHPTRGWASLPNRVVHMRTPDYRVTIRTNGSGFRDIDHPPRKRDGARRLVLLGDSFMEAYQVELEECLARRLARGEPRLEVLNLGVEGYGTLQEWLLLREEGFDREPDIVVLAFYGGNDIRNNSRAMETALRGPDSFSVFGKPFARWDADAGRLVVDSPDYDRVCAWAEGRRAARAGRSWYRRTLLWTLGRERWRVWTGRGEGLGRRTRLDPYVWLADVLADFDSASGMSGAPAAYATLWSEAWECTQRILEAIRSDCVARGVRLLVMTVPGRRQVDPLFRAQLGEQFPGLRFDPDKVNRALETWCATRDVALLDLLPVFRAARKAGRGPLFHQIRDTHWNAAGHAVAAEALAKELRRLGWQAQTPGAEKGSP